MANLKSREEKRSSSFVKNIVEQKDNTKEKEKYIGKTYYITPRLSKAIIIKTADGELDRSGGVRAALEMYLEDILNSLPE